MTWDSTVRYCSISLYIYIIILVISFVFFSIPFAGSPASFFFNSVAALTPASFNSWSFLFSWQNYCELLLESSWCPSLVADVKANVNPTCEVRKDKLSIRSLYFITLTAGRVSQAVRFCSHALYILCPVWDVAGRKAWGHLVRVCASENLGPKLRSLTILHTDFIWFHHLHLISSHPIFHLISFASLGI